MNFGKTPTQAVVERIAAAEGVDPLDLQPPLFDAIDTEALDTLINSANSQTSVQFVYQGYTISVDGDCNVELEPVSCESDLARTGPVQCE